MSDPKAELRLLVLIAKDEAVMDELITGMLDVGITGATIVESKGLGAILHQDMPIFSGLASLLPQYTGSRMVFALTTVQRISDLQRFIDEVDPPRRPVGLVIPIEDAFGFNFY